MRLLFLDIDGVLNDHSALPSGYCGIQYALAERLNCILSAVPDAQIVVSSAWRYMILEGAMTLKGFGYVLSMHGVKSHGRMHGYTEADFSPDEQPSHFDRETWKEIGIKLRAEQIAKYVMEHQPIRFAVLDDLPLNVPNLVQTDGTKGITDRDVEIVIETLKGGG